MTDDVLLRSRRRSTIPCQVSRRQSGQNCAVSPMIGVPQVAQVPVDAWGITRRS
ncbi:MAG: hypothetical protein HYR75_09740 [Gemmatimonadetes bacterium]|nr:hypothetical protein [Gemmatimonadota bacterium]